MLLFFFFSCNEELSSVRSTTYPGHQNQSGSKNNDPPKTGNPTSEASVPIGLPLAATRLASPSGKKEAARTAKRGKEKEVLEVVEVLTVKRTRRDDSGSTTPVIDMVHSITDLFAQVKDGDEIHRRDVAPLKKALAKRDQRIKELESKLKTAEETGNRIPSCLSNTSVWGAKPGRPFLQPSRDVRAALEVSIDEDDLPKILAVLPEDVPDPRPTPFSKIPDEQASGSAAGASAGPTAEAAVEPSAGPTVEGVAESSAEPLKGASSLYYSTESPASLCRAPLCFDGLRAVLCFDGLQAVL
nr:uncharacterized protein LOC109184184 [Ipomoea trifida]